MSINLSKGGNINLSKEAPGLNNVIVGIGWDVRKTDGEDFDLDASCFIVDEAEKALSEQDFIFYNNVKSPDTSVEHQGDNRTGEGEGDDEQIKVILNKVNEAAKKIVFCVTIHEAEARKQNFGMVSNAFIRIVDEASNKEVARFDLSEDASTNTAMIFGELYRHSGNWKFKAVEQGYNEGLPGLIRHFGLS